MIFKDCERFPLLNSFSVFSRGEKTPLGALPTRTGRRKLELEAHNTLYYLSSKSFCGRSASKHSSRSDGEVRWVLLAGILRQKLSSLVG